MIGSRLAHFTITAKLGEGGMGEVYRAEDSKLGREVALKILPEAFVADPDRVARFEREARLLASLNHPNIAGIYEVGAAEVLGGDEGAPRPRPETAVPTSDPGSAGRRGVVHYLAMELARGETLGERLEGGALAVEEALTIARQIAAAVEAAHRQGIVHRDLKPANVVVDDKGAVKVLDFGLAKAFETTAGADGAVAPGLSQSPTLTARMTSAGMILGTAAYMSPEQAKGEEADKRSDIWSFGVVLWEMLTGRKAFGEKTVSESLAAVLMREPDLAELPPKTPRGVRRLLERCLQKDPDQRLHDMADGRLELEAALRGEDPEPIPEARSSRGVRIWQAMTAVLLLAVVGLAALEVQRRGSSPKVLRATILPPEGATFELGAAHPGAVALSADGSGLAFTARREGAAEPTLWVRPVDSLLARELPSTEGAEYPFWSPDGRYVGFFTLTALKKIAVAGGPPVTLAPVSFGKGASWSRKGQIVFTPGSGDGISVVPEAGGEPRELTTVDAEAGENSHRHPRFLPDGEHYLYFVRRAGGGGLLRVGSITGDDAVDLVETPTNGAYASGRLLFVREGTLMAQPFDADALETRGEPVPLVENLLLIPSAALAVFSASEEGSLVYQAGQFNVANRLLWIERGGSRSPANAAEGSLVQPRLSPDATRAFVQIYDEQGESDLWVQDLQRGIRNRLTFDAGDEFAPVWSPDGERFVYASDPSDGSEGAWDVWSQPVAGTEERKLLTSSPRTIVPVDWSPDGAWIIGFLFGGPTGADVFRLAAEGGEPELLLESEFGEGSPVLSPDGRWLAYFSNTSASAEIYVTTFPEPGRKWQVSVGGGYWPTWRGDGREIFYRTDDGLWGAEVDGSGGTFAVGEVTRLFDLPSASSLGADYDVAADGQRFLFALPVQEEEPPPITLVLGWDEGLP